MPRHVSLPLIKQIDEYVYEVSISKGTSSGSHEVPTSEGTPSVEIVFFHGLQFDGCRDPHFTTWLSKDKSTLWLVWLLEEIPNARILLVSYDAGAKQTRDQGTMDRKSLLHSLTGQRANVGQYGCPVVFVRANIGQYGCPVVFVGHGLGGLVMKELCLQASLILNEQGSILNEQDKDERVENLVRNVKGLFFFATPHRGPILDFFNLFPKGPLLKLFKTLNKNSARTNEEFRRLGQKYNWRTFGVGESRETTLGSDFKGMLVPEASSRSDMDYFYTICDADHFTVCQPESKESSGFKKLLRFVEGFLKQGMNSSAVYGPQWFEDPYTWDKMCDPVKCTDGNTYDRWTIVDNKGVNSIDRKPLEILVDDLSVRPRLFETYPEQERKFRDRREKYRKETLELARHPSVKLEDALDKLENVIKYRPNDTECLKERDAVLRLMSQQSSLENRPSRERVPPTEGRPYEIPVLMHEDVIRARGNAFETRLATLFVFVYIGACFLSIL